MYSQHLLGRAAGCHLRLEHNTASSRHAEIRWTTSGWEVRDLGARNGTFLDGHRMNLGASGSLICGSQLAFGRAGDIYELIEDDPPMAAAINEHGQRVETSLQPLMLPDSEKTVCMVYEENGQWFVDMPDRPFEAVESGRSLAVDGMVWTLDLPVLFKQTLDTRQLSVDNATARFYTTKDEEHVELELDNGTRSLRLPPRAHWYTLMVMARQRLKDTSEGQQLENAGWMDKKALIQQKLKITADTFNTHMFRGKRELFENDILGYPRIVERLRNGKVRFGMSAIEIKRL